MVCHPVRLLHLISVEKSPSTVVLLPSRQRLSALQRQVRTVINASRKEAVTPRPGEACADPAGIPGAHAVLGRCIMPRRPSRCASLTRCPFSVPREQNALSWEQLLYVQGGSEVPVLLPGRFRCSETTSRC